MSGQLPMAKADVRDPVARPATLTFTVFGVAQPKGSARAFVPKGWHRAVVTSDNPKNKGWQQLVAEAASQALTGRGQLCDGPVSLTVSFLLPRPKSLPRKVTHHLKKPDLDKLIRSVKDALTKVVWQDDSQVTAITATKAYAGVEESPRAVITVRPMETPLLAAALEERTDR